METTDNKNTTIEGTKDKKLEKMLTDLVMSSGAVDDINVGAENIDSSQFENVSMEKLLAAKGITSYLTTPELLKRIKDAPDPKEALLTVIVAEAYLKITPDDTLRAEIKELAEQGKYQDIYSLISAHENNRLSVEKVEEMLKKMIPQVITKQVTSEKIADFTIESKSGTLGQGISITSEAISYGERNYGKKYKMTFEHYDFAKDIQVRIIKQNDQYKVTIHTSKLSGKNELSNCSKLSDIANTVFGSDMKVTTESFSYALARTKQYYQGLSGRAEMNQMRTEANRSGETLFKIVYNKEHNLTSNAAALKIKKNNKLEGLDVLLTVGGIGAMVLGGIASVVTHTFNPLLYTLPLTAVGLTELIYGGSNNNGSIERLVRKGKLDKACKKYLISGKAIQEIKQKYDEASKGAENFKSLPAYENIVAELNQDKNIIDKTFDSLSDVKGYSLVFETNSEEEAYMKAYQVAELIGKQKTIGGV